MLAILIILSCLVAYLLLLWLVPKGNILHEGLRIPLHLIKLRGLQQKPMQVEKIYFGEHHRQYFLLCTPKTGVTQRLAIIYYHGGAWMFGRPEMFFANAGFFIEQGYAVVMPSHRRPPWHRYHSIREDLNLAIQRTAKAFEQKKIDIDGWIASGMSAGANLAALLALDQGELQKANVDVRKIKGLLLLGAPLDFSAMPASIPLHSFAGWRHSDTFRAANPMSYLPTPHPMPLLSIHGTKDGLVPYSAAYNFFRHWPPELKYMYTIQRGTHLDCSAYVLGDQKMQKLIQEWLKNCHCTST